LHGGRAAFITGMLPIRSGMTTVGQAGSPIGMPDKAPTIATALKAMGYATGQFGKTSVTKTRISRPFMASTSFSATSTTSMRWKTPRIPVTRKSC